MQRLFILIYFWYTFEENKVYIEKTVSIFYNSIVEHNILYDVITYLSVQLATWSHHPKWAEIRGVDYWLESAYTNISYMVVSASGELKKKYRNVVILWIIYKQIWRLECWPYTYMCFNRSNTWGGETT